MNIKQDYYKNLVINYGRSYDCLLAWRRSRYQNTSANVSSSVCFSGFGVGFVVARGRGAT